MNRSRREGYGARPLRLLGAGIRDRLSGHHARANARWGHLRAPAGRGPLVWVRAGADEASVHLAAELLAAIRGRRRDVRLVLTYEGEHRAILRAHLAGLERIGFGYGPCDARRALRRTLDRLDPLGVIVVARAVSEPLTTLAQRRDIHLLAYHADPPARGAVEAAYPAHRAQAEAWRNLAGYTAPTADAASIFTQAQVEPVLRSLVQGGGGERAIWWLHGGDPSAFVRAWRASPLAADGVLFASAAHDGPPPPGGGFLPISGWPRTALAEGTAVWVDEARWLPGVAAAACAAHLETAAAAVVWQALAAGVPLTLAPPLAGALAAAYEGFDELGAPAATPAQALAAWMALRDDPARARRAADAGRRRFWDERRRADAALDELLERVFEW